MNFPDSSERRGR